MLCHLDGDTNVFIFTKWEYFWTYTLKITLLQQVGESILNSTGTGIVLIYLNNQFIIPLYPCYHINNNP